jgi:hypothetical protein
MISLMYFTKKRRKKTDVLNYDTIRIRLTTKGNFLNRQNYPFSPEAFWRPIKWRTNGAQVSINIKMPTLHLGSEVEFKGFIPIYSGVGKGARTLNHLIHSQVLCQLSYAHHGI